MKKIKIIAKSMITMSISLAAALNLCTACDKEYDEPDCYCSNGGNIGGWDDEENESDEEMKKDSTLYGWEVTMKEWNDTIENNDIEI